MILHNGGQCKSLSMHSCLMIHFHCQLSQVSLEGKLYQGETVWIKSQILQLKSKYKTPVLSLNPESTFRTDSLLVSVHPRVQSHALTSVRMIKILQSMSEFGGLWQHKHTHHAP